MDSRVELFRQHSKDHPKRNNTVHIVKERADGYTLVLCGDLFEDLREIPTDHATRFCRHCMAVKDSHDTRGIQ